MNELSSDTRTRVKQVADDLLAEGIRPTVANVRARTGRGSASTINEALKDWWAGLAKRLSAADARPDIPAPVFEAANVLWSQALEIAHAALAEYRREAAMEVQGAKEDAESARLARQQAEERIADLECCLEELELMRLDLERRAAAETARREHAEQQIAQIRAEAERAMQAASQQLTKLKEQLASEQVHYARMEKRLEAQLDEQKCELVKTRSFYEQSLAEERERGESQRQALETRIEALDSERVSAYKTLQDIQAYTVAQAAKDEAALAQATEQLAIATREIRALRETHEALAQDKTRLEIVIGTLKERFCEVRQDFETQLTRLRSKLAQARQEIQRLREAKVRLEERLSLASEDLRCAPSQRTEKEGVR
jgi:Plasmid replication region DNA-binding N-term.